MNFGFRNHSRAVGAVAVLGTIGLLVGCGSSRVATSATSDAALVEKGAPAVINHPDDARFISQMIGHCERDQRLAESMMTKGGRKAIVDMARQIREQRATTLEFLRTEQSRLGIDEILIDPDMAAHTDSDERRLSALNASDADDFFVAHLTKHNLEMSRLAAATKDKLRSPNLKYYAQSIPEDSSRELRDLRSAGAVAADVPRSARAGLRGAASLRR